MLRRCLAVLLLVAGFGLAVSNPPTAAAAPPQKVDVRTGLHDGYARIVVEWQRLPPFQVLREDLVVTIRFAQPMSATLDQLVAGLEGRITGAEIVENSHALRLYLSEAYELRAFPLANMAVLDLIGGSAGAAVSQTPPAKAAPLKVAPATPKPVVPKAPQTEEIGRASCRERV